MIYHYFSIAIMTLLASASSFAASAVLPPLPSQQPPPVVQDSVKPPPSVSLPSAEPTLLAPPTAEKQNPAESLPTPTQAPTASTSAPTQMPTSDAKKTPDSPQGSQEEGESFMDKGQKQLPRIQHEDKSMDSGSYNPSDLRIPVIESAEKDAAKSSDQSNPQGSDNKASDNSAMPAADAAQAAPAAHVAPDISLPEAAHPAQAAGSAAATPPVSAQTPPQAPATASEAVTTAPAVSAPPTSTVTPVVPAPSPAQAEAPPTMAASATDAAIPAIVQTPTQAPLQPSAPVPAIANAAPAPIPVPALQFIPAPAPSPPPAPVVNVPQPQPQPQPQPHAAVPSSAEQLTADQIKFIEDEAIVFTLADDDVELGKITEAAEISQMPAYNYIKLFWKSYQTPLDKMHERDVDLFLSMLETPPAGAYSGAMNYDEASDQAFEAASEGKLSDLRVIISHYPVLQMRDGRGNNMLGSAIEADRLEIARFLLARGIDLYATNYEGYDAFAIAGDENNDEAIDLLSRARFVGRK